MHPFGFFQGNGFTPVGCALLNTVRLVESGAFLWFSPEIALISQTVSIPRYDDLVKSPSAALRFILALLNPDVA